MMRKIRSALAGAAVALAVAACASQPRAPVGAVADRHVVVYPPYETVRMVRCPVCGGTGTLQRSYVAFPRPAVPYAAPVPVYQPVP
jgi:hypothetical protein